MDVQRLPDVYCVALFFAALTTSAQSSSTISIKYLHCEREILCAHW